ncbi:MAG TPA: universal stress protein [Streptosporangiaceae bacterium]|nr:universal stress protein [Streptosporangiaceae bacterium]
MRTITVGVDGSAHAHYALEWAVGEAAAHHATLNVVTVNPVAVSQWTQQPISYPADERALADARDAATDALNKLIAERGGPQPASVSVMAVNGNVVSELLNASRDSDLLVVGSRGGGGFSRLSLGSVSGQIVHHARCPVVVVPHGREE